MSKFVNPDLGFTLVDGSTNALGKVYFGLPNTDAKTNPKVPYLDAALTLPAGSTQTLTSGGKLAQALFLSGAYSIITDDVDENQVDEELDYRASSDAYGSVYNSTTVGAYLDNQTVADHAAIRAGLAAGNYAANDLVRALDPSGEPFRVQAKGAGVDDDDTVITGGSFAAVRRIVGRDVSSKILPYVATPQTPQGALLQKLRTTTYTEFCVYTALTADNLDWHRWYFTNRFNVTNDGAPRMIICSLAHLYASDIKARTAANNVSETTANSTTATRASSTGATVGTWTGPGTVLTTTDVIYSSTIGDTITFTITGVERIVLRSLWAGNGGIGLVTITESAVEIPEANYLLPSDHLVNLISTATGNTTMHHPLASGLTSGSTYTVEIKVDASNPVGNRVYTAGLLGYADIVYSSVGINGLVLDAALGDQTNSASFTSGTTAVYQLDLATKVDWSYVETNVASVVNFTVYDSVGAEISVYENQTLDAYAVGSTARKVTVAKDLPIGTYYLHVENGKTKNASSTAYRYYDFGAVGYDQNTPGVIDVDPFDDNDVPQNVQDPNNDTGGGSDYLLIGTGNLELAISVRKTTDAVGSEEFVGGIHGLETTPVPVFYADGIAIDYAGAAQYDTFTANEFTIDFTTTLQFPVDSSSFCTAVYTLTLDDAGYSVYTKKTTLADAYIHHDYSIMMNCPSTDTNNQGGQVGGGFKYVSADINYKEVAFDNSSDLISRTQHSAAMANGEYATTVQYSLDPETSIDTIAGTYNSLIQDRADRTVKFYTRAYDADPTNGYLATAGATSEHTKLYRVVKGSLKSALGVRGNF
jgi:hypothetical protein